MKTIKKMKGWAICQLNTREVNEYGFSYAVIHPDNMDYLSMRMLTPSDTDMECETLDEAVNWIKYY